MRRLPAFPMPNRRAPMALFALALLWVAMADFARARPDGDAVAHTGHGELALLAEAAQVVPGQPFWIGLRLRPEPGWHTYWRNPGDSGLPVSINWQLSPGTIVGDWHWPYPEYIPVPPFASFGYHREVLLLARVQPGPAVAGSITLAGDVQWLVCREVCLPERAHLSLTLPVADRAAPNPDAALAFSAARAEWPRALPQWQLAASAYQDRIYLELRHAASAGPPALPPEARFFPQRQGLVEASAPQRWARLGDALRLELPVAGAAGAMPQRLAGVLVAPGGWDGQGAVPAMAVDLPLAVLTAAPPPGEAITPSPQTAGSAPGLALALLLALAGGALLNLMPCVFPVLSVKVLGLVEIAGGQRRTIRQHSAAYAAGVLLSFWLLAGLLIVLRQAGRGLGWGFQLQSPLFVALLALLLLAVALNLLGLFEVGLSASRLANVGAASGGLPGMAHGRRRSFLTGVLAAAVATPCTAPFMSVALGYALTQPPATTLLVFSALAIGMVLPYVLLTEMPGLLERLPRPGIWMVTLRQVLAFPVLATVVWLLWVFGRQQGVDNQSLLLMALLLASLAAWLHGRWQRRAGRGALLPLLALVMLALGLAMGHGAATAPAVAAGMPARQQHAGDQLAWQPWSAQRVAQLRAEGKPVFVDFTAAWCITCQVNKRIALYDGKVRQRLADLGVQLLRADWTHYDAAITEALAGFGRSGVPLYLYYPPGGEAHLLPELLTPGVVLQTLRAGS